MVDEEGRKEDKFDEFDDTGEAVGYISLDDARILGLHICSNLDFYELCSTDGKGLGKRERRVIQWLSFKSIGKFFHKTSWNEPTYIVLNGVG